MEKATQSVLTALRVIEQVSVDQPARLGDLARSLGLPKTTTHRLLNTLNDAGWLRQDPQGSWLLSLRCAAVGLRVSEQPALKALAEPALRELALATRENVRLWLAEGETLAVIDSRDGDHAVRPVEPPARINLPLHAMAVGKAVLASWPEHDVDRWLGTPLRAITPHTITDPDLLRAELARVRSRGYAEVLSESAVDVGGVAAAFRLPGDRLGALAVSYPVHRASAASVASYGDLVSQAAQSLQVAASGSASMTDPGDRLSRRMPVSAEPGPGASNRTGSRRSW
jgi:IclR family acetate operon transcriptional repressor